MVIRSEVLKEKLQQYGWSQNKLAIKANVSKGTISRVINGKRGAGRKVIAGILRIFPEETVESLFKEKRLKTNIDSLPKIYKGNELL